MHDVTHRYALLLPDWLRRLGLAGFAFFLAKGMSWLALPYLAAVFLN